MNSREKILAAVKNNQPAFVERPAVAPGIEAGEGMVAEFVRILESIGGATFLVSGYEEIAAIIKEKFADAKRVLSNCPELSGVVIGKQLGGTVEVGDLRDAKDMRDAKDTADVGGDAHGLADADLAILRGHFGVAENGSVWLTEERMINRVLPFICQHLAVVIDKKDILPTMREAYGRIADLGYDFGVFIAGPSKTADIEQSLVLGAHGPVSMTVFVLG